MRRAAIVLLALLATAAGARAAGGDAAAAAAEGDAAYARRAEGFLETGKVSAEPIGAAVAAYERAVAASPDDLALRFKLVEALYFQGHFAETERDAARKTFTRLCDLAEDAVSRVAAQAHAAGRLQDLPLERQAELLAPVPHAAEAHFWAAIAWGLWAMSHSKMAAGFHGAAEKIRDHARLVTLIDPGYADAGGLRLLGRLHAETPHVPMFTGWIDRRAGLELLERANAASSADPRNPLFLAEALLENAPDRRDEALRLLAEVSARQPAPDAIVEQSETLAEARRVLAQHAPADGASP